MAEYTITKRHTIANVQIMEVAVAETGEVVGYIRREEREVPARRVFYPCTTTRVEWVARYKSGKYTTFLTRKAAAAYIMAEYTVTKRHEIANVSSERVWHDEAAAKADRRKIINEGRKVSLIAGDYGDGIDVYVFDVYN